MHIGYLMVLDKIRQNRSLITLIDYLLHLFDHENAFSS